MMRLTTRKPNTFIKLLTIVAILVAPEVTMANIIKHKLHNMNKRLIGIYSFFWTVDIAA